MRKICILSFLLFAVMAVSAKKKQSYDVAAYVWPAYHNDPRWAELGLFPDGKGEWEDIYNAVPKYEGHRQPRVPLWGYLDEASPKTQQKIIKTALKYGVNTLIFDWYWYENRPFLEDVLNKGFLKARNCQKMNFYLMWANHTATSYWDYHTADKGKNYWSGRVTREIFEGFSQHLIDDYFLCPNYYRIDGKPVFAIYEIGTFIDGMGGVEQAREALDGLRAKCIRAGLPGLHIQAICWSALPRTLSGVPGDQHATQDNTLKALGFDSVTNYQFCHLIPANRSYKQWGEEAQAMYERFDTEFSVPYFPHVSVDWDPNPRYPADSRQPAVTDVTPAQFRIFLQKAKSFIDAHPDQTPLVTINAWNEWAEGSTLEPDTHFGYQFLEAIRKTFLEP